MMKKYRVVITSEARQEFREKIEYIRDELKNPQAIKNVWADYKKTREALSEKARMIKEPDSEKLREYGLRRINFRNHDYFLLFRIKGSIVEVTNVFHQSEDFENKLK